MPALGCDEDEAEGELEAELGLPVAAEPRVPPPVALGATLDCAAAAAWAYCSIVLAPLALSNQLASLTSYL